MQQTTNEMNTAEVGSSQSLRSAFNRMLRKRTLRNSLTLLYILIVLWVVAICLLQVVKRSSETPTDKTQRRNVFEAFNSYKIIFKAFGQDDYYSDEKVTKALTALDTKVARNVTKDYLESLRFNPNPQLPPFALCSKVIEGDLESIEVAKLNKLEFNSKAFQTKGKRFTDWEKQLSLMVKNCHEFRKKRQYVTIPLSIEEKAYPIAYIITIHKSPAMFEQLFRAIYQPQNLYCIHVDKKAPEKFLALIRRLTACFDNAFVASNLTEVHYSHYSRVQADINCMHDLNKRHSEVPWRYVINLCGQDFPLKTNLEITRALKNLQGYNNLETFTMPSHKMKRYMFHYKLPDNDNNHATMIKTDVTKASSPLDTPMFGGSAYYIFKYKAVRFILSDPMIEKFLRWNEDTYSPDEHIWATLQRWFPSMPGSQPPHMKYDLNELQSITRLVKWGGLDNAVYPKCAGSFSRGICVYGVGDLSWLLQQHHLFANKFDPASDPFAADCLDQWLRNRTISQGQKYLKNGFV